ncbi:hypothetical protein COW81_01755 [Candidatus Campbellbacteria bacterium CG22_combo_CG10-13_8_21_14_all_36_13]|uniref:Uncharacterized protein n=1 Tax=Candidatus Campbellbacteria bacterium CG22_combo_CG10-13_8_21_14_all_36_13 TaxID=1974529 RepID=A0A2H0DY73_9BACT|nr:MAG: hypothetical protein COW81_01755 [Candidatus Campbellbacteria bacterium CG22_combo_CG10-13_8_21_14_all_36_13]
MIHQKLVDPEVSPTTARVLGYLSVFWTENHIESTLYTKVKKYATPVMGYTQKTQLLFIYKKTTLV